MMPTKQETKISNSLPYSIRKSKQAKLTLTTKKLQLNRSYFAETTP